MNERDPRESPIHTPLMRGRPRFRTVTVVVGAVSIALQTGAATDPAAPTETRAAYAQSTEEPLIEDEIKVIGERTPLTTEERMRIYRELAKARQLYSDNEIDQAFPLLLKTARKGFKNAQARVGHIYLRGLGNVEQDPVEAMGWLGVASSGTSSPPIRNYFNDIWQRIPDKYVGNFEEVVEEYRAKYGENATGVVCELHRPLRSFVKQLLCYFEQDLPDMVREPLDDYIDDEERARLIRQNEQRVREYIQSRRGLPTQEAGGP
ncbi:MAG: sel1 repeat family protein [Pseudomonadales bacterium]|nr:sel1 repeat family protein [Pseudomonadales bacterium]